MSSVARARWVIWGRATLFLAAVAAVAVALVTFEYRDVVQQGHARLQRFVSGAEADANRALISIDLTLASLDQVVANETESDGRINGRGLKYRLQQITRQGVLVADLAVIGADGQVLAAARTGPTPTEMALPEGFVSQVLKQPMPRMVVSAPMFDSDSAERVIFLARPAYLGQHGRGVVVAQVNSNDLGQILGQPVDDLELVVTLEGDDGLLLTSRPANERHTGKRLAPALTSAQANGEVQALPGRLDGQSAWVSARPLLYGQLRVVGSLPIDQALARWRFDRVLIRAVALLFAAMVVTFAWLARSHTTRMARARAELAESKGALEKALSSMHDGLLLCDEHDRVVMWNQRYVELFPWLGPVIGRGVPFRDLATAAANALLADRSPAARAAYVTERMQQRLRNETMHTQIGRAHV